MSNSFIRRVSGTARRSGSGIAMAGLLCTGLITLVVSSTLSAGADETTTPVQPGIPEDREQPSPESCRSIRGRVVDENDNPVPNAVVDTKTYEQRGPSATSDENGGFLIAVPAKTQRLWLCVRNAANTKMWVDSVSVKSVSNKILAGVDEPLTAKLSPVQESLLRVVDEDAQPVADATVVVQSHYDEVAILKTDEQGQALARVPENGSPPMVIAFKSGVGYDYFSGDVRDTNNYPVKDPPQLPDKLVLALNGARTVHVKAVDSQGQPVPGITVQPWYVNKQDNPGETNFGSSAFTEVTDNDGLAVFDWLPPGIEWGVMFWVRSEEFDADRLTVEQDTLDETKHYEVTVLKRTALGGRVVDAEGQPVAGASVQANGAGMSFDSASGQAMTDADGMFSMTVPPDKAYVAHATSGDTVGFVSPIVIRENQPVTDVEIQLKTGTFVRGKVTRGTPPKPVANQWLSLRLELGRVPEEIEQLRKDGDRSYRSIRHHEGTSTDENGLFLFIAAPGEYVLSGPRQAEAHKFTITTARHVNLNFHVPRPEFMQFTGIVRNADGKPIANARIHGVYASAHHARHEFIGMTNAAGRFDIERETQPAMVHVHSSDQTLAMVMEIDGELEEQDIVLKPTCQAHGRLLNDRGDPRAGEVVRYGIKVHQGDQDAPWIVSFGGRVTTDKQGTYALEHLAQGVEYDVDLERSESGPWSQIATVNQDDDDAADLGAKRVPDRTDLVRP